jgi:hypothetical protein
MHIKLTLQQASNTSITHHGLHSAASDERVFAAADLERLSYA